MPQPKNNDYSGMHEFQDQIDPELEPWGSFEVFQGSEYYSESDCHDQEIDLNAYYWWSCFAGCLPDGDPIGPFGTSSDAYYNAQGF